MSNFNALDSQITDPPDQDSSQNNFETKSFSGCNYTKIKTNSDFIVPENFSIDLATQIDEFKISKEKVFVDESKAKDENGNNFTFRKVFSVKTGRHRFRNSTKTSDLHQFGVGITLYFKLLKYVIFIMLIASILSVPVFVFNQMAYDESTYSSGGAEIVFKGLTLGSIGLDLQKCEYFEPSALNSTTPRSLGMNCPSGKISNLYSIYGIYRENIDVVLGCEGISLKKINNTCNNETNYFNVLNASCHGKSSCTLNLTNDFFNCSNFTENDKLMFYYQCQG